MRWITESFNEERARKNAKRHDQWLREREWHRWFAWYPVEIGLTTLDNKERAWLCIVERRLAYRDYTRQPDWFYWDIRDFQYRFPRSEE